MRGLNRDQAVQISRLSSGKSFILHCTTLTFWRCIAEYYHLLFLFLQFQLCDTRIVDLTRRCKPLVFAFYIQVRSTKMTCHSYSFGKCFDYLVNDYSGSRTVSPTMTLKLKGRTFQGQLELHCKMKMPLVNVRPLQNAFCHGSPIKVIP